MSKRTLDGAKAADAILHTDISILSEHGCHDDVMEILAAEHGARVETLCKIIDPQMGKAILMLVAGGLLKAAKQIEVKLAPVNG